jgi:hypothetical protein
MTSEPAWFSGRLTAGHQHPDDPGEGVLIGSTILARPSRFVRDQTAQLLGLAHEYL